jgi:hypothetical protein
VAAIERLFTGGLHVEDDEWQSKDAATCDTDHKISPTSILTAR